MYSMVFHDLSSVQLSKQRLSLLDGFCDAMDWLQGGLGKDWSLVLSYFLQLNRNILGTSILSSLHSIAFPLFCFKSKQTLETKSDD